MQWVETKAGANYFRDNPLLINGPSIKLCIGLPRLTDLFPRRLSRSQLKPLRGLDLDIKPSFCSSQVHEFGQFIGLDFLFLFLKKYWSDINAGFGKVYFPCAGMRG